MPHQCVRCGNMYTDGAKEVLSGCSCGSKYFFFITQEKIERAKKEIDLTQEERLKIEQDVKELIEFTDIDDDEPVFLDFESVRILKQGNYQINLRDIFKGNPLVYKLEDGKYIIDLASLFKSKEKKQ